MTAREAAGRAANHLAGQTSPYLLQHVHNPVDWYPWGPEALERARTEDRPIFLSIGYAACHWCHVMERESFEDPRIAGVLNEHFVSIKVDREERPDIDEIYMAAVQMLTGQGGWPMTVFLTPDLKPFFGGTYFPPDERHGRISFGALLERIRHAWSGQRNEVARSAAEVALRMQQLGDSWTSGGSSGPIPQQTISRAAQELASRFDSRWGGFGAAPKFPPDGGLALLLRESARGGECILRDVAEKTLDAMATGGMYDHVGGGFARYSVDERWLVPHFEKMLYNQALLVPVYADAWRVSPKPLYRRVVEQTLDFVRRELTAPEGGFLASLDADSEGVEGKFYVWTPAEVGAVLDAEEAALVCDLYDITEHGNFEGASIPNLLGAALADRAAARGQDEEALAQQVEPLLARLLEARADRVRPATDDKVLTAWNGLMISAYCRAYQTFGREEDLETARRAAEFVTSRSLSGGRLLVTWRAGRSRLNAYLDDYAFVGRGLLDLYESCFERRWLDTAAELARTLVARFEDRERGGFFFTSDDHEELLTRNRSLHDGALPAGSGVAAELSIRLAAHLDDADLRRAAENTFHGYAPAVERLPSAFAALLLAADLATTPPLEVAIVGSPDEPATLELLAVAREHQGRRATIQLAAPDATRGLKLLEGKTQLDGRPTAYVCRAGTCLEPTRDPAELRRRLVEA